MHASLSVWFSTAKGAVVSQVTVSPLTWVIPRQENARQGSRSHFPILVKLFALWWQMLVQTSDITVRSQIAKACAHCRRPDCGCLFRSYAVDIYAIRSFSCLELFALWRTPTRHRSTSLELQLPIPGSCCRRPRLFCCQTNVRRKFSQNECLWSLQTSFSRMFGEICFCLLLDTSATATNLLNWTGEASGCLFFGEGYKFQYVIATACKKAQKPGLLRANFLIFFVIRQSLRSPKNSWFLFTILHSLLRH